MKQAVIRAKDLCKTYASNGQQNHVLRNIDLTIYEGDFTVIMGSSGSGKSTLLYSLSGMDTPTSGEVFHSDLRIDRMNEKHLARFRRDHVGFVFQQMHLISNLSLFENLTVPGYLARASRPRDVEVRAKRLLTMAGISELLSRLPSQVSGGQQQRAGVARALINQPAVLFADEPTGALNSKAGREILNLLSELNQEGQSILMVTHDIKAAIRANRIIYLQDGKIIGEITFEQYRFDTEYEREQQVLAWLNAKGW